MNQDFETKIYERIPPVERFFITIVVVSGVFMAILDTTVVEIILPKIMAPLATDIYGVQWVVTSYMIASAIFLLLIEPLAKTVGLKWTFITGETLFTTASFLCANASTLGHMIIFRSLQGIGEALIIASGETIIFTIYPPEKRGLGMGIYALAVSFAPALGPTLGGYLTEHFSWHHVFLINLPVGIIGVILSLAILPEVVEKKEKFSLNFIGFIAMGIATINLLTLLSKGQQKGWFSSPMIVNLYTACALFYFLFFISEYFSKNKLIEWEIFKFKEFTVAIAIYLFILGLSMYQVFYLLPIYYERLRLLGTFDTGLHILPMALTIGIVSIVSGILSDKIGEQNVLVASSIILIIGTAIFLPKLDYYTPKKISTLYTIPWAIGVGMFFAPITTLALRNLGKYTNLGVSLLHYIRFIGGSFGTAIATNTLQKALAKHHEGILSEQFKSIDYITIRLNEWTYIAKQMFPGELAEKKVKALLNGVTQLMALNDALKDTFASSAYFAFLGLLFLIPLLVRGKKNEEENNRRTSQGTIRT
ncbi:MAG: DHA2 family efflux MFS transporter permease subunit [Thermosulfidibacteraceae bacterium]|jgi:DHA2 family multidrug resistance protein